VDIETGRDKLHIAVTVEGHHPCRAIDGVLLLIWRPGGDDAILEELGRVTADDFFMDDFKQSVQREACVE